jgi:hypothetical protein
MEINFERERRAFRACMKVQALSASCVNLWYGLMNLAEDAGWPDFMKISMNTLINETKLGKDSIRKASRELHAAGRIEYIPGESRAALAVYKIIQTSGKSSDLPTVYAESGGKSDDSPPVYGETSGESDDLPPVYGETSGKCEETPPVSEDFFLGD